LRQLAETALAAYDIAPTGLRLISSGWNGVFGVDTPDRPLVLRITRPIPGADERSALTGAPASRSVSKYLHD
jgi:hypothetical protein